MCPICPLMARRFSPSRRRNQSPETGPSGRSRQTRFLPAMSGVSAPTARRPLLTSTRGSAMPSPGGIKTRPQRSGPIILFLELPTISNLTPIPSSRGLTSWAASSNAPAGCRTWKRHGSSPLPCGLKPTPLPVTAPPSMPPPTATGRPHSSWSSGRPKTPTPRPI